MSKLVSLNPATGDVVGEVAITQPESIPQLVAKARTAQPKWAALGIRGRSELWLDIGERIVARSKGLGELLSQEMGKPVSHAIGEIKSCGTNMAESLAEIEQAIAPESFNDKATESVVHYDPHGVCAVIAPWNFPFSMPHWMTFPALATGNTVVLKPSEETPLIGQAYADILNSVLPEGVLTVVHGADLQGRALVDSPVDLIAFTGSRETGKKIMAAAARDLKRLILELGGKDPLVVLADADLPSAAKFAARNSFRNAGQVCVSTERILVDASVEKEFVDLLKGEAEKLRDQIGPMISAKQRDHVLAQLDSAIGDGAEVVMGGSKREGNFVDPTILVGVKDAMAIARDETFGPVACVTAVASEESAVETANNTKFGLGAVVFGGEESAARVARQLTAGMIGINKSCGGASGTPWVGARESGFSFHGSKAGHRNFTQPRVVSRSKR